MAPALRRRSQKVESRTPPPLLLQSVVLFGLNKTHWCLGAVWSCLACSGVTSELQYNCRDDNLQMRYLSCARNGSLVSRSLGGQQGEEEEDMTDILTKMADTLSTAFVSGYSWFASWTLLSGYFTLEDVCPGRRAVTGREQYEHWMAWLCPAVP